MTKRNPIDNPLHSYVLQPKHEQEEDIKTSFHFPRILKDYYPSVVQYPKHLESKIPEVWEPQIGMWKDLLVPVVDQGGCGSCWAFCVVNTLSDRYNIWANQKILKENLSPFLIITCNMFAKFLQTQRIVKNVDYETWNKETGCYGNILLSAILYIYFFGIPTEECFPYRILDPVKFKQEETNFSFFNTSNTNIHIYNETFDLEQWKDGEIVPSCSFTTDSQLIPFQFCVNNVIVNRNKYYGSIVQNFSITHFYSVDNHEKQIQLEILANGPVVSAFLVYEDFYTFDPKKGVYKHNYNKNNQIIGGHAVEIVGWGKEPDGTKFWWIKNTWGVDYGYNGYFKFLRGVDMCNIEDNVHGFFPDLYINYKDFKSIKQYQKWIYEYKYLKDKISPKLISLISDVLLYLYVPQNKFSFHERSKSQLNLEQYFKKYGSFGYAIFIRDRFLFLDYSDNYIGDYALSYTSNQTNLVSPFLLTQCYKETFYASSLLHSSHKNRNIIIIICVSVFILLCVIIIYSLKN